MDGSLLICKKRKRIRLNLPASLYEYHLN